MTVIVTLLFLAFSGYASDRGQASIDVYDLVDYRLTPEVFDQFVHASRLIGEITRRDPTFTYAALFTKEVALSGDASAMASGLMARLDNHAELTAALQQAKMTAREYAKFAICLLGARMAQGFLNTGVLRSVPAGAPTINVEFVKAHDAEIVAVLAELGIKD